MSWIDGTSRHEPVAPTLVLLVLLVLLSPVFVLVMLPWVALRHPPRPVLRPQQPVAARATLRALAGMRTLTRRGRLATGGRPSSLRVRGANGTVLVRVSSRARGHLPRSRWRGQDHVVRAADANQAGPRQVLGEWRRR